MPRYYRDDSREVTEYVAWSVVLAGQGLSALWNALRPRPDMYYPKAPDDPTQVPTLERFLKGNTIDLSRAKLPKVDLSAFKSLKDFRQVKVEWNKEDRPQLVKGEENPYPFVLPISRDGATVLRIHPTPGEVNHEQAVLLMEVLLASCPKLSFEIVADPSGTYWQIVDLENSCSPDVLTDHIKSYYPTADVVVSQASPDAREYPFYRQLILFGLSNDYAAPLPFYSLTKASQLVTVANRMDLLSKELHERISYRLITYTRTIEAENRAGKRLAEGMVKPTGGLWKQTDAFLGMDEKLLNAKLDMPQYHAFLTLTVESREEGRLPILIQSAKDLTTIAQPRHNGIITVGNQAITHKVETSEEANLLWFETLLTTLVRRRVDEWRKMLMVLSPEELANVWHLPDERFTARRIAWKTQGIASGLTRQTAASVCIGEGEIGGKRTPVYTTPEERINHTIILGKNGVGKSTLIHQLVHQDIAAGHGVVVIDAHGELIHDILASSIPASRHEDVLVLSCGNTEVPVPLNPFRVPAGISFDYANSYLYWLLRKIYASIWIQGRMDFTMKNVIQALLTDPEATPLDVSRVLTDDEYRDSIITKLLEHDDVSIAVTQYWQQFREKTKGEKSEIAQPIISRTGAFVGNRALELMTCHPTTLNFKELLTQKKILLIDLSGDSIRAEANNLGAIFLAHLYLGSQSLGVLLKGQEARSYVYVDEADRFVDSPLPDMFSEARKYGLAITLATQFLSRLPTDTQEGIFGNVGTQYLFELGLDDAKALEKYVLPLTSEELINLGKYRMMVKTRADGKTQPAFLVSTHPAPEGGNKSFSAPLLSAEQGFMPKAQVSAWLKARYAPKPKPSEGKESDAASDKDTNTGKQPPTDGLTDYE